jgi:hypothetical protein
MLIATAMLVVALLLLNLLAFNHARAMTRFASSEEKLLRPTSCRSQRKSEFSSQA